MMLVPNQLWRRAAMAVCVLSIAGEAAAQICIDVNLRFAGRDPSPVIVRAMQNEAGLIWQQHGVQIQWPASLGDVECPSVGGSFDVLVEYQPSLVRRTSALPVLGRTHLAPARIDRVGIYVDYDETQSHIESVPQWRLLTLAGHPDVGPADIGRALGRVLAHEIGHVVLGVSGHQPFGLMRRSFAAGDLVTSQRWAYTLSKKEVERLGLRERELRGYEAPASAAPSGKR
jgi:hypothetical protein